MVTELEHDLSDDPDIDPELGAFLLHHARAMAQAVRDVPVRETAGLEEALNQAVGAFCMPRPHLAARADPPRVVPSRPAAYDRPHDQTVTLATHEGASKRAETSASMWA